MPMSGADVFPNDGDVVIMLRLPKQIRLKLERATKSKETLQFYVGVFERRDVDIDDCVSMRVRLHGSDQHRTNRRGTAKDEFERPYYPMWYKDGENEGAGDPGVVQYAVKQPKQEEFYPFRLSIDSEVLLPVSPFPLLKNWTIPTQIRDRIQRLLYY